MSPNGDKASDQAWSSRQSRLRLFCAAFECLQPEYTCKFCQLILHLTKIFICSSAGSRSESWRLLMPCQQRACQSTYQEFFHQMERAWGFSADKNEGHSIVMAVRSISWKLSVTVSIPQSLPTFCLSKQLANFYSCCKSLSTIMPAAAAFQRVGKFGRAEKNELPIYFVQFHVS